MFAINEAKPKRLHICVFDAEIKSVIKLNEFNVWAAVLWDNSVQVFRVAEK